MFSKIFGINFEDKPEEVTKILDKNYLIIKEIEKIKLYQIQICQIIIL